MEPSAEQSAALIAMVRQAAWMMDALRAARELGLRDWCIGAGALRNLVWDHLHGHAQPSSLADVDLAYFDAGCLDGAQDAASQARLCEHLPGLPWEVTNQAAVHLWFERYFGHAVEPLVSLHEAVASWPEYATAVGVRLHEDERIEVIAPLGLDDLLGMVVRRNPRRVSVAEFRRRTETKAYPQRWPYVTVIPS